MTDASPELPVRPGRDSARKSSEGDARAVFEAMEARGISSAAQARSATELSNLSGIAEGSIRSIMARGARDGVFESRMRFAGVREGKTEMAWWLSPAVRELNARFTKFADAASQFVSEVERIGSLGPLESERSVEFNVRVVKTIFGKWFVDIIALVSARRAARFQEIRKGLGRISGRVLSLKLAQMERLGLISRSILDTRPPRVLYSLTGSGQNLATLLAPVILYLRLVHGWTVPKDAKGR